MLSKFKNLFLRSDLDEKNAFRNRVLEIVRAKFPEIEFSRGDDLDLIDYRFEPDDVSGQLGLTNLYAMYLLTSRTKHELEELVESKFGALREMFDSLGEIDGDSSWDDVKLRVMPQLMPNEYSGQFEALNIPFGDRVQIGFVIDRGRSYSYITQKMFDGWTISVDEVYDQACDNLGARSQDLAMTFVPEPEAMIMLSTQDGFDATRILIPTLRAFIAEKLGEPFHFGVPNRDFLICWSASSDASFREKLRRQVADDFTEQPYSLSGAVFEMRDDGEIKVIKPFTA